MTAFLSPGVYIHVLPAAYKAALKEYLKAFSSLLSGTVGCTLNMCARRIRQFNERFHFRWYWHRRGRWVCAENVERTHRLAEWSVCEHISSEQSVQWFAIAHRWRYVFVFSLLKNNSYFSWKCLVNCRHFRFRLTCYTCWNLLRSMRSVWVKLIDTRYLLTRGHEDLVIIRVFQ